MRATRASRPGQMIGGAYYDDSWAVMSLLMMTGNFLDYTAIQPGSPNRSPTPKPQRVCGYLKKQ